MVAVCGQCGVSGKMRRREGLFHLRELLGMKVHYQHFINGINDNKKRVCSSVFGVVAERLQFIQVAMNQGRLHS